MKNVVMMKPESFTQGLLSREGIRKKLPTIFQDVLITDLNCHILMVSQNVLDLIAFSNEELVGKSINYLAGNQNLAEDLQQELAHGYFEEIELALTTKDNRKIRVGISGFYLGLVTDINGRIIFKIRHLQELEEANSRLCQTRAELDEFIYRIAHDLRGPLSTIRGLVNLLKMRKDDNDLDLIIGMVDAHAEKLDQRLFQLVYLTHAEKEKMREPDFRLNFKGMEAELRNIIRQNAPMDHVDFHFYTAINFLSGVNDVQIQAMLNHVLLYLLSLLKASLHQQLFYRFVADQKFLKITIGANGFLTDENLRTAILQTSSVYTDLLNYPRLVDFYAAQKIAWTLGCNIRIRFVTEDKQRISIIIPLSFK